MARWMSPELLDPDKFGFENSRPTKESDYYALGMVTLEVLTGQAPFPRCNGLIVLRKVTEGEHPGRPRGGEGAWFTDDLWEILERCWSPKPGDRPTVNTILECLKRVSVAWKPPSLTTHSDVGMDTGNEPCSTVSDPGMFPYFLPQILTHLQGESFRVADATFSVAGGPISPLSVGPVSYMGGFIGSPRCVLI